MNYSDYTTMNYQELAREIEKNKAKIKKLQDTIRLLEKLQIAEQAKRQNKESRNEQWR